ncbi:MAG TPA: hypothetical protein VGL15_11070 [Vicinamibacteria bacterium]|jgi:hypothetical protein
MARALGASSPPPRGVWIPAAFFALSGVLALAFGVWEAPPPRGFWTVWDALGRSLLDFLIAFGLWRRIALGRSLAMVYCLAALVTYAFALGLAFAQAPVRFPPSVVVESLFQVPSCALLFPFLRSARASELFPRPLFGR